MMDENSANDDRVKTRVVGHRDAHYPGEPKSRREIHELIEDRVVTPPMMDENSAGCASEAVAPLVLAPKVTCIPVRVFNRDGMTIYSKVDDQMLDLTDTNCEGHIIHTSSYYVPRGATPPAPTISQDVPAPAAVTGQVAGVADEIYKWRQDNSFRWQRVAGGPFTDASADEELAAHLNAALSAAPTISQDVPAPAAVDILVEMLGIAAFQFETYATLHSAKGTPEGYEKATANAMMAGKCRGAIERALSAATPLQSDLAAENARLLEAVGNLLEHFNEAGLHISRVNDLPLGSQVKHVAFARAALQGADNHE